MNEFKIIQHYFQSLQNPRAPAADLGIGDDCALVQCPPGQQLAISADTLINGVHFLEGTPAADVGYKALAVNLSDLAAMGATPAWFTLCLSLPEFQEAWLRDFCAGMADLIAQVPINLIGGDTTRGGLSITIQVMGTVQSGQALRRTGAMPGDDVYLSGEIGAAGMGLRYRQAAQSVCPEDQPSTAVAAAIEHLNRPFPRVVLGQALIGLATSCIDVSDGLLADLNHLLVASKMGAELDVNAIPLAASLAPEVDADASELAVAQRFALNAGDDYELCFTAPAAARDRIHDLATDLEVPLTRIGVIRSAPGLTAIAADGQSLSAAGYQHF